MLDVPFSFRVSWGMVVAKVLREIEDASNAEEQTAALLWWLLLPQAFLRQSRRGGKRGQGSGEVQARFQAASSGDWGKVIDFLEADLQAEQQRKAARQLRGPHRVEDAARTSILAGKPKSCASQVKQFVTTSNICKFYQILS